MGHDVPKLHKHQVIKYTKVQMWLFTTMFHGFKQLHMSKKRIGREGSGCPKLVHHKVMSFIQSLGVPWCTFTRKWNTVLPTNSQPRIPNSVSLDACAGTASGESCWVTCMPGYNAQAPRVELVHFLFFLGAVYLGDFPNHGTLYSK